MNFRADSSIICGRENLGFFFLFPSSFLSQVRCWVWSSVIVRKNVWWYDPCVCVCFSTHVSCVCCKVMSVSPNNCSHVTLSVHWLTQLLPCPHRSLYNFFKDATLLLLYVEEITPSLSLYLVFPFSFSARISVNPPLLLLLSMRPLCSAFHSWTEGLYIPHSHWLSLTTWSQVGCPALKSSQLSGCSHGITLQLQWEESGGREGDRERERRQAQNGHG